jgi:hypothetical protein
MSNKLNIPRQISTRIVLFHLGIYFKIEKITFLLNLSVLLSCVVAFYQKKKKLCSSLLLLNENYKVSYVMR